MQESKNDQKLFGLSTQEEVDLFLFQLHLGWPVNVLNI